MADQLIEANVATDKTYAVVCPHCHSSRLCQVKDLPLGAPNPYQYECTCGMSSLVMLNYRKTPRKPVKLMGTIIVPSEPKKIERVCEIHDISGQGMRVATDYFKTISLGTLFLAKIILDDPRRSKLEVPCLVRNMRQEKLHLMMNIEFVDLDESQRQAMKFYMMKVELEIQK